MNVKTAISTALWACLTMATAQAADPMPVSVSDAIVRVPIPGQDNTAAFLTLSVRGDEPLTLQGVSTPVAERAELHTHTMVEGMMRMRKRTSMTVTPDKPLVFAPGERHIMLLNMRRPIQTGDRVELILDFGQIGQVPVSARAQSLYDQPH